MNKIFYFLFIIVLLAGCRQDKPLEAEKSPPNIIIIVVDDLGKEWISHYGAEDIATPNIDALAESGITFNNVYSMPQCTPTRVTILTGQYPFRHGWVNHWDVPRWGGGAHFDETINPSIGKEMKKAGYSTCIAGKWQIDDFRVEPDALTKNGFDEFCMWTGYESGVEASANRYQDPYVYTKEGSKTYSGEFGPDLFKNFIIDFIHNNKEHPMFIYYPMVLTHTPFVDTPVSSAPDNLGKHIGMVKYTDLITGEIVKALENEGIRENTVIIWTTDNGTTGAITGKRNGIKVKGGKSKTIEPGINAPFIVSWPGKIKPNRISNALIDFTDIFPTCLDLAGTAPKENVLVDGKSFKIDGSSFKDVLMKGKEKSNRKWILGMGGGNNAALTVNGVENQYVFRDRVLRNQKYKLYINSEREPEKFFDLLVDDLESNNLLDSLNTEERKGNFNQLLQVSQTFPKMDNDPKYYPNPSQTWDVEITEESQLWKK
jgi:arylsulfatase A-like enzyme